MLRNIDLDEISDGKLYTAGDLAKVGCQDCEGCCDCCCQMGDTIILDPLDVWQLMQGRGKSFEQLLDESRGSACTGRCNFAEPENGGGKGAVRIFERKRTLQHPSVPPGHLSAVSAGTFL